jgi:hypothetical protein
MPPGPCLAFPRIFLVQRDDHSDDCTQDAHNDERNYYEFHKEEKRKRTEFLYVCGSFAIFKLRKTSPLYSTFGEALVDVLSSVRSIRSCCQTSYDMLAQAISIKRYSANVAGIL